MEQQYLRVMSNPEIQSQIALIAGCMKLEDAGRCVRNLIQLALQVAKESEPAPAPPPALSQESPLLARLIDERIAAVFARGRERLRARHGQSAIPVTWGTLEDYLLQVEDGFRPCVQVRNGFRQDGAGNRIGRAESMGLGD